MTPTVPSALPSGVSQPLEVISSGNLGGAIAIVTALALTLVLLLFPIQVYTRVRTSSNNINDYVFTAALVWNFFFLDIKEKTRRGYSFLFHLLYVYI